MSTKTKIIIGTIAIAVAFAGGRWSAPTKIKTEIKTVEVEKKSTQKERDINRDKKKETTITEITHPDGTKEVITKITEGTQTSSRDTSNTEESKSNTSTSTTEITRSGSRLSLAALGGLDFDKHSYVFGGHVSKEFLGPVSMGLWGLSNGTGGVSLGLSF